MYLKGMIKIFKQTKTSSQEDKGNVSHLPTNPAKKTNRNTYSNTTTTIDSDEDSSTCSSSGSGFTQSTSLSIFNSICEEDWKEFMGIIKSSTENELTKICHNSFNILEQACKYNPPLSIVKLILDKIPPPSIISQRNKEGQYPIHIAAKYGTIPEVIQLLILKDPSLLSLQDYEGRTPLHLACKYYSKNYRIPICVDVISDVIRFKKQDFAKSVEIITVNGPGVTNMIDKDDCTALEYALLSNVDHGTYVCIANASSRSWRKPVEVKQRMSSHDKVMRRGRVWNIFRKIS